MSILLSFLSSFIWLGFVEVLALGLLPLWSMLLSSGAEKVLGYSRILSLLLLSWICWILSQYCSARFDLPLILTVSAALLAAGHIILRLKFVSWRIFLYDQKLIRSYYGYLSIVLLLIVFRACSPEIYWGEKPLEFSLFNYLIREDYLPAEHPWASGSSMSYYYMGFFTLAILQKISLLDPSIGFNLGIVLIGAGLFSSLESLLLNLRLSRRISAAAAFFLTFGANFNPVYLALEGKEINFDLFWLTTRNFTSPAFAEYPLWSLLFADLHPHVMAMPLVICLLGLIWASAYHSSKPDFYALLTLITGMLWGLLYSVNGWDFISNAFLLAIMFGFSRPASFSISWIRIQLIYICLLLLGAAITVLPFRLAQKNIFTAFWGWVTSSEYNSILHILLHQGIGLSVVFLCGIGLFFVKAKKQNNTLLPEKMLLLPAIVPLIIGIISARYSGSGQAWQILWLSVIISAFGLLFYSKDYNSPRLRFCCLLLISGSIIISVSESFYLIDRMNTIFKGYQILWPVFGVSACILFSEFSAAFSNRYLNYYSLRCIAAHFISVAVYTVLTISFFGTLINLYIMLPLKRTSNERFTLNGSRYIDHDYPDEAFLIRWLQKNVKGKAYIAEAFGDGYQSYSRVTMHTGLPNLIGWEHHARQGGVESRDLERRKSAIRQIFDGSDAEKAYELLQFYGIDFIFIGKLEREKYSQAGLLKFASRPDLFIPMVWRGEFILYLTNFSPLKNKKI